MDYVHLRFFDLYLCNIEIEIDHRLSLEPLNQVPHSGLAKTLLKWTNFNSLSIFAVCKIG